MVALITTAGSSTGAGNVHDDCPRTEGNNRRQCLGTSGAHCVSVHLAGRPLQQHRDMDADGGGATPIPWSQRRASILVALVQTAYPLSGCSPRPPPAGYWLTPSTADVCYLLAVQLYMATVGVTLAALTAAGQMQPPAPPPVDIRARRGNCPHGADVPAPVPELVPRARTSSCVIARCREHERGTCGRSGGGGADHQPNRHSRGVRDQRGHLRGFRRCPASCGDASPWIPPPS